jgi:beta-glucosidase-like glycosyl hydrolase/CubicO group peptidase (beta-lactamase class C family)
MKIANIIFLSLSILFSTLNSSAQINSDSISKQQYVDAVFSSMSLDDKIAQTIMIRAHSNKTASYHKMVENTIRDYNVGGLCFFQGGPARQIDLINKYQSISQIPLLIAIDGEWGAAMRLDSLWKFPRQMTLGAIQNDSLIYEMGVEIARQMKLLGVNINFAPVADVNNNPLNPVINSRSFGEKAENVAKKSIMYMKGMQDNGVIACAKHFPGHGDTDADSHKQLPSINCDSTELANIHLYPFQQLIDSGIQSVMVAHLSVPTIDSGGFATTLSEIAIEGLLKKSMNFKGLIITDALEMKGVTNYFEGGELAVKAFQAGNDILLMPENVGNAIESIKKAVLNNEISEERLEHSVKKILAAKYDANLLKFKKLNKISIIDSLNTYYTADLIQRLYNEAITLVKNENDFLPLSVVDSVKTAIVNIGNPTNDKFAKNASYYRDCKVFNLNRRPNLQQINHLENQLANFDVIVFNYANTSNSAYSNYGIYQASLDFINKISAYKAVVVNLSANPYSLKRFESLSNVKSIIISYEENSFAQTAAAQAIFGGVQISGRIPFSSSNIYKSEFGIELKKKRLSFKYLPTNNNLFYKIDSIVEDGIKNKAYPGAQVLIAYKSEIIYNKNFGYLTYSNQNKVNDSTIYDLASLTKVLATTFSTMKLYEENKIDIDLRLGDYLNSCKGSNKENIVIRDIMAHQSQLKPWIPFYIDAIKNDSVRKIYLQNELDPFHKNHTANNLYFYSSYKDTILDIIIKSDLLSRKKYKYSDLGMYLMREIIDSLTNRDFNLYNYESFYQSLGMYNTMFNPLNKIDFQRIAPTENDTLFRKQLIRGYVHDQGAAMIGGISGHAGLFSNAIDISKALQMLLWNGEYGGQKYFKEATIKEFTRQQFPLNQNRRGLGFDKPLPEPSEGGPTCKFVSDKSYGHSGFTGTYFWVDPEYDLIYIFLSNRIYPNAENRKLISMNIRTEIQAEIYKSLGLVKKN